MRNVKSYLDQFICQSLSLTTTHSHFYTHKRTNTHTLTHFRRNVLWRTSINVYIRLTVPKCQIVVFDWLIQFVRKEETFLLEAKHVLWRKNTFELDEKCNFRIFCFNIGNVYEENYENFLIKYLYEIVIKSRKNGKKSAKYVQIQKVIHEESLNSNNELE